MAGRVAQKRPLRQHQCKTVFLRVPTPVWPLVSTGRITEFRAATGNAPQLWHVPLPTFAVAYRRQLSSQNYDYRLLLLEGVRREALGTITEQGLARAGYEGEDAFARFRRDWMIAEKKRFEPLRTVFVYTVRLVQETDLAAVGSALVEHLYGEYREQAQERTRTINAGESANRAGALGPRRRGRVAA